MSTAESIQKPIIIKPFIAGTVLRRQNSEFLASEVDPRTEIFFKCLMVVDK